VRRVAWLLACVAVTALWVLILLADGLFFLMSYTQPADSYTGQDWDRAASWFLLGLLVTASALAIAVIRLPVVYCRLRALARFNGYGLKHWLARQHPLWLARTLMTFNAPIMIIIAVGTVITALVVLNASAPAGTVLWTAAAGLIAAGPVTAVEIFLLRGRHPIHASGHGGPS
jgi:hypothetical protein